MQRRQRQVGSIGFSLVALYAAMGPARAETPEEASAARLSALQQQLEEQTARLETLKRAMAREEANISEIRRALGLDVLASQRGAGVPAGGAAPQQVAQSPAPVGQARERESQPVEVAPIFEQPGVLTPKGKFVVEPSLQYAYSSSNRVALVGYTIIPAIVIGVIDVREVKRNSVIATLAGRYGVSNRFEIEARLPYVYRTDTSVGRPFLQPTATDTAFSASGSGIGDIELTGRYQFNEGGADKPYLVGSLRLKTRTGKDPFEVESTAPVQGLGELQTELPRGSGFYGLQPALTVLYPSDPAVLFGTVSYLHSIKRSNVTRRTSSGSESLGDVAPGGVFGFNFGLGLGLNEKSSFSIGYDHASVGRTKQNGQAAPDSVRVQLGTLLFGYSYRLTPTRTLNVSLGAGITRDTPDVTLTVRLPTTF